MGTNSTSSNIPTARLLLDAFRAFENELLQILKKKGFNDITMGNFNILRHIDPEGIRLSNLASDAQLSKQAIGKMIGELEYKGYVELIPVESDGRGKLVRFSKKGTKLINIAVSVVSNMESHYQSMLGESDYEKLRDSVQLILQWHLSNRQT